MRIEKIFIFILIIALLATFIFIGYLFFGKIAKSVKITSPAGGEELKVGETYKITWEVRGIKKVGIVLFKGQNPKWIAEDIEASSGVYEWKIYPGQDYGDNFSIAVIEYPWQEGAKASYTDGALAILYPESNSCDAFSIEKKWPYVPSDFPNIRKVFITENTFTGNLDGFEGANKKCQEEAKKQGYLGVWRAFIGADADSDTAVERLRKSPKGLKGVFVEAKAGSMLARGIKCHALLGKDFDDFLSNFSDSYSFSRKKFSDNFFQNFGNIWLGRLNNKSKSNCIIAQSNYSDPEKLAEQYSYTSTCQRWTNGEQFVQGYNGEGGESSNFPTCYTPQGVKTSAVSVAGLSEGIEGKSEAASFFTPNNGLSCDSRQKLLCVEE